MKKTLKKSSEKETMKTYYALRGTCGSCGPCGCTGACPSGAGQATHTEYGIMSGYNKAMGY